MSRSQLIGMVSAALAFGACLDEAPSGTRGHLTVEVAPLNLSGLTEAEYTLSVRNLTGDLVWTRALTSSRFGDGAGSLSYVGPCDADASPNRVELVLRSLSDTSGPLAEGPDFTNPAPAGDPLAIEIACLADQDVRAHFDLTVARAARQGFFDVAVQLTDVYCSAKLDCRRGSGQNLTLLSDPLSGARALTAVLGFACTAGPGQDTWLYMDDLAIACDGASFSVDPSGGPGQLNPSYTGASDELLFQAAVYRGAEQLPGVTKGYWNVALGLNEAAFSALGPCTLHANATGADGQLPGGLTPPGVRYPYITWDVELVGADGILACATHAVNGGDGVAVTYSDTSGHGFAHSAPVDPASALPLAPTLLSATGTTEDVPSLITLTFTEVPGALSYTATCTDGGSQTASLTVAAPASGAVLSGLSPGVTYECTVTESDGAQSSPPSNALSVTPTSSQPEFSSPYSTPEQNNYSPLQYPGSRDGVFYELGTRGGRLAFVNPSNYEVTASASDALRSGYTVEMGTDRDNYDLRINDDDGQGLTVTWTFGYGLSVSLDAYWMKYANFGAGTTLQAFTGGAWETLRTWAHTTLRNSWGESWAMVSPSGPITALRLVITPSDSNGWHNIAELELFGEIHYPPEPGPVAFDVDDRYLHPLHGAFYELGTDFGAQAYANPADAGLVRIGATYSHDEGAYPREATTDGVYTSFWLGRAEATTITWTLQGGWAVVDPSFLWARMANISAGTKLQGFDGASWVDLYTWSAATPQGVYGESWLPLSSTGTFGAFRLAFTDNAAGNTGYHAIRELEPFGQLQRSPTQTTAHPAELLLSADDAWVLWIDGVNTASSVTGWESSELQVFPLPTGARTLAVRVKNGSTSENPTAFLAQLSLDGDAIDRTGVAGTTWKVSAAVNAGWEQPGYDDSAWGAPQLCSSNPWGSSPADLLATGAQWVGDTSACSRAGNTYTYYRLTLTTD